MKVVLFIYLVFSAICILLVFLANACANAKYKRRYPNLGLPKRTFIEHLTGNIRAILFSCIPILNVLWFFTFVFKWEGIIDEIIEILKKEKEEES